MRYHGLVFSKSTDGSYELQLFILRLMRTMGEVSSFDVMLDGGVDNPIPIRRLVRSGCSVSSSLFAISSS